MKDKIIELLEQNSKEGWSGDAEAVGYADFESVAEQLVKLFTIHDVVVPKGTLICSNCNGKDLIEKYWTHECRDCGQNNKAN